MNQKQMIEDRKWTLKLLERLTELCPLPEGKRHAMTAQSGYLMVTVIIGDLFYSFLLEDRDMAKRPSVVAEDVAILAEAQGLKDGKSTPETD